MEAHSPLQHPGAGCVPEIVKANPYRLDNLGSFETRPLFRRPPGCFPGSDGSQRIRIVGACREGIPCTPIPLAREDEMLRLPRGK